MIGIVLVMAAAGVSTRSQTLASPAFTAFYQAADAICPAANLRVISPADLDDRETSFIAKLSPTRRHRLLAVDDAEARCADRNGLSCPSTATLEAFVKRGLMRDFAAAACTGGPPD